MQRVEIGEICPYCMTVHACGVLIFLIVMASLALRRPRPIVGRWIGGGLVLGLVAVGALIGGQMLVPAPAAVVEPIADAVKDYDTGPGPNRRMSAYGGKIEFSCTPV